MLLLIVGLVVGFVCGRVHEHVSALRAREKAKFEALPNNEKIIALIEKNAILRNIRRLLDVASLTRPRAADGITPIMATMRYVARSKRAARDTIHHQDNPVQRYRILRDIVSRLPESRVREALNAQDQAGWSALMYAADQSDVLGAALLIRLGADPTIRNSKGETAADIACRWPDVVPVFKGCEEEVARVIAPGQVNELPENWP